MKIQFLDNKDQDALYLHYDQQTQPQPVYLYVDPTEGTLSIEVSGEIGNSSPADVWHHLRWRFPLPSIPTPAGANNLMEAVLPYAEEAAKGFEITWDGSNHRGHWQNDGEGLYMEILRWFQEADEDEILSYMDADTWAYDIEDEALGIFRGLSASEIAALESEWRAWAAEGGIHLLVNVEEAIWERLERLEDES